MEDTNSCPAFIERQEGPFTTSFELQQSPNLSRLSSRFGNSFLGADENDENNQSYTLHLDTPPTPPYRKNSYMSPKRTPPSPTVLRASGVPHFIKRRCYSPRRSNSVSSIPVRRLYEIYEQEGISIEDPTPVLPSSVSTPNIPTPILSNNVPTSTRTLPLPSRKRPCLTSSTSSLPDFFKVLPERVETSLTFSDSAVAPTSMFADEKTEEERVPCLLPTIPGSCTDFNRIDGNTVSSLLAGDYNDSIDKFVIMDCRYEYEYQGGHIKSAINMSPERIFDYFRDMPEPIRACDAQKRRLVIVMHCEFSSKRAPDCIRLLRQYDRSVNNHRGYQWPLCSYPDVYLLDGGYKGFYTNYVQQCEPQNYVPEKHKLHQQSRSFHKRTRKEQLRRSQSFSI